MICILTPLWLILSCSCCLAVGKSLSKVQFHGRLRLDFSQYTYSGAQSSWQTGMRCNLESTKFSGLQMETDFKYRYYNSKWKDSLKALYKLAISYQPNDDGLYLKVGRFNLYNLSGIGELDGAALGWNFSKDILTGLYLGYEPDLIEINTDYQKRGVFFNYRRASGFKSILSCNQISYQGLKDRTLLYGQAFLPLWQRIYQYLEYELDEQKKLTRLFLNTRLDLTESISMTGSYYFGQGYDQELLAKIKSGQVPSTEDLQPFYWYQNLSFRTSLRLGRRQRISAHAALARKEKNGDALPRYGLSYFIDGLVGGRVGGGVRLSRSVEKQTIRNMLSLELDGELYDWLNLGLTYTNYTFQLVEEEIISPPGSSEYGLNFSVRINRQFFVYGYIQYIVEDVNCWQNYLSLVYRL